MDANGYTLLGSCKTTLCFMGLREGAGVMLAKISGQVYARSAIAFASLLLPAWNPIAEPTIFGGFHE